MLNVPSSGSPVKAFVRPGAPPPAGERYQGDTPPVRHYRLYGGQEAPGNAPGTRTGTRRGRVPPTRQQRMRYAAFESVNGLVAGIPDKRMSLDRLARRAGSGSTRVADLPRGLERHLPKLKHDCSAAILRLVRHCNERGSVAIGSYAALERGVRAMGCPRASRSSIARGLEELRGFRLLTPHWTWYVDRYLGKVRQGVNYYQLGPAFGRAVESLARETPIQQPPCGARDRQGSTAGEVVVGSFSRDWIRGDRLDTTCSCLDAALWYAGVGSTLWKLRTGGKVPMSHGGRVRGLRTKDEVVEAWTEHPDAGVGIVTGRDCGPNGLWVLDVDPRNGGDETLAALVDEHGPLPETPTVITGGGGLHLYFRYPATEIAVSGLGPGLDVLANGRMAVAPPSVHPNGTRYEWAPGLSPGDVPLAEAPAWLLEKLRTASPCCDRPRSRADDGRKYHQGQRDEGLFRLVCRAWHSGLRGQALSDEAQRMNTERCVPPLPERMARYKATHVESYYSRR